MANVNPKALIEKLNQVSHRKLMEAAALCSSRTHYEVQLEHWLIKLLEIPDSDLTALFRHYEIDPARVRRELEASLNRMKTGSGGSPKLSPDILDLVREAWVLASLEYKVARVRTGILLATLMSDRQLSQVIRSVSPELGKFNGEQLQRELPNFFSHTAENEQAQ